MNQIGSYILGKLISLKGFSYYNHDIYLINHILKFSKKQYPRILDVGCGNGHYSFLFEKCGSNVTAFDYDEKLIGTASEKKNELGSSVKFMVADGNCPLNYFRDEKFDIVFLSGFSLFGIHLNKNLLKSYLSLVDTDGILIFIHNSNLTGAVRKTNWRNHTIENINVFFEDSDVNIEKIYFYDRHFSGRILKSFVFYNLSTKSHLLLSEMTGLPCNIVCIVRALTPPP